MHRTTTWALCLAIVACFSATRGYAQAPQFVIVPVTRVDDRAEEVRHLAEEVQAELLKRKIEVFPLDNTSKRFSELHSREPVPASRRDLDLLASEVEIANEKQALGQPHEALKHLKNVRTTFNNAIETLSRDAAASDRYVKACMDTIKILVIEVLAKKSDDKSGQSHALPDQAVQTAMECIATSPDTDFTRGRMHPRVLEVFSEARKRIENGSTAPLIIESEPPGCRVLLGGSRIGTSPKTIEHPLPREYLVQVEGGVTGRVHPVRTGEKPVRVFVDVFFDKALRTSQPMLRLSYDATEDLLARSHAMQVAQILGAQEALIISAPTSSRMQLRRVRSGDGAAVYLDFPYGPEALSAAVERLLAGDGKQVAEAPAPTAIATVPETKPSNPQLSPPAPEQGPSSPGWVRTTGTTLTVLGVAGMVTSYALFSKRSKTGRTFRGSDPTGAEYEENGSKWFDERPFALAAAGVGAASASAGVALLASELEPRERLWLPITAGLLGLASAGWGVFDMMSGGTCSASDGDARRCVLDQQRLDRGTVFTLTAVPLLTLPVVQIGRWLSRGNNVSLEVRPVANRDQRGLDAIVSY